MKTGHYLLLLTLTFLLFACNQNNSPLNDTGSISGRVYFDHDANAGCDECECGIEKVKIRLYEGACQGLFLQTVYSDGEGYFLFEDLEPKEYCVLSDLPPTCDGYLPTTNSSQIVMLGPGEDLELGWFGYDNYVDVNE